MQLIPLFPLQIIVFPTEELNLHIFEPRYRQLVHDAREDDLLIGIPFYRDEAPLEYGTMVRLDRIAQTYEDGRMDIMTVGVKLFVVNRFRKEYPDKLYPGGYVTETLFEMDGDVIAREEIRKLLRELYEHMKIEKWPKQFEGDFTTFDIGHKVGFSKEQEYELLKIVSEMDRQQYVLHHLNKMVPMIKEAEEMRKKVQMNGHFKHLQPPSI